MRNLAPVLSYPHNVIPDLIRDPGRRGSRHRRTGVPSSREWQGKSSAYDRILGPRFVL